MTSLVLKEIINKILAEEPTNLVKMAEKARLNRSNLQMIKKSKVPKEVAYLTVNKLRKAFPSYFQEQTENNTRSAGTVSKLDLSQPLLYDGSMTVNDLIMEKEARRRESMERALAAEKDKDRLLNIIESSLGKVLVGVDTLQLEVKSDRQVSLKSLARIEKPKGDELFLLKEADNIMKNMSHSVSKKDKQH